MFISLHNYICIIYGLDLFKFLIYNYDTAHDDLGDDYDDDDDDCTHNLNTSLQYLSGVLARDKRIPIDISFHVLALHPLGRDYRQDPLGFTDQLVYNTSEATKVTSRNRNKNKKIATTSGSISPLLARQKLQEIIKSNKND